MQEGRRHSSYASALELHALALWPRLDAAALRRCGHDPRRIARLIARRSALPVETILSMLVSPMVSPEERETWFG